MNTIRSPTSVSYRREDELSLKVEHNAEDKKEYGNKKKCLSWYVTKRMRIALITAAVLVVLLVVVLLLVFVGGKAYAQKHADKVEVKMNYVDLKSVEPNVDTRTLDVEFSMHLKHDGPLDATLDAVTAYLAYDGKQFGTVGIPEQRFESGPQEYDLVVRTDADIFDQSVLAVMSKDVVRKTDITLQATAEGTVSAMGLTFSGISVDRSLKVQGFNRFTSPIPMINSILMKRCVGPEFNIVINATIDNVSQLGLDGVGALNMTVYYEQTFLGYAVSVDPAMGLPRGPSSQEFEIAVSDIEEKKTSVVQMGLAILSGQQATFFITGENPLATQVKMLQEAVQSINMTIVYDQGLEKVTFGEECSLSDLIEFAGVGGLF